MTARRDLSTQDQDVEALRRNVTKLTEINRALMRRVEHSLDLQGNAYQLFQTAILLDQKVRDRTRELEHALQAVEQSNLELSEAIVSSRVAQGRLQDAIDSISEGFAIFDPNDQLILYNRRFLDFWPNLTSRIEAGISFDELVRLELEAKIILPDDRPIDRWIAEWRRQRKATRRGTQRWVYALADGRWVQVTDRRSIEGGIASIYTDITDLKDAQRQEREKVQAERQQAKEALHDSEQRIRLFANAVPAMISYVDHDQRYRFVNRAYRTAYAPDGAPILGRTLHAILGDAEYEQRQPFVERALNGHTVTFDLPLRSSDDHPRFGLATYVPHRSHHGAVVGFYTLIQDITERRQAEQILEAANEELERRVRERTATLSELNETLSREVEQRRRIARELQAAKVDAERANVSKTKFLADASHDLLQPLNAARLFVAALQNAASDDDDEIVLSKIDHALGNVEDLLNILLDMSKLDSGHVSANIEAVRLAPLMEALRDELAPLAEHHGLSFRLMPCRLSVQSDPRLLRRLLQNFLTNACRYTLSGRVLFGARRRGSMLELQVHDTGVGIPEDKINEIFQEFRRLDPVEGGRKGYGLGLSIVARISRLLGYQVKVRSRVGRGSCFSVLVPLADTPSHRSAPRPAALPAASPVDNVRILLIDNDQAVLDGMARLLQTWRCQAVAVANRRQAQAHLAQSDFRPQLLLADYHLDDGDVGTALISDLRDQLGADIPAAVITADRSPEVQAAVQRLASASLLTKPIKPARLRALIASVRR